MKAETRDNSEAKRYCSYDDIPLLLDANDIVMLTGLARTNVYYMLRADDFPVIVIGKRRMVKKEKLFAWLDEHEKKICPGRSE
ncbi:MAG: helix-turn-helix domain-containing protein [Lachnospiraceae bacterium]|nr:helix-turn-helix domain-containing protein [Lachnospiraceae bacterium]